MLGKDSNAGKLEETRKGERTGPQRKPQSSVPESTQLGRTDTADITLRVTEVGERANSGAPVT